MSHFVWSVGDRLGHNKCGPIEYTIVGVNHARGYHSSRTYDLYSHTRGVTWTNQSPEYIESNLHLVLDGLDKILDKL